MTAITTASNNRDLQDEENCAEGSFNVKTTVTIPQGAIVQIVSSTGRVTNASNVAGRQMCGIALETKTGGAATVTVAIRVRTSGTVKLVGAASLTKAYLGCNVAVVDNNTVSSRSVAGTALNSKICIVGRLKQLSSTNAWVEINNLAQRYV